MYSIEHGGVDGSILINPGTDSDDYIRVIGPNANELANAIVASMNRMETAARLWVSKDWRELTPIQQINNIKLAADYDEVIENSL